MNVFFSIFQIIYKYLIMRAYILVLMFLLSSCTEPVEYALVIHGGAGNINRESISDEMEETYRTALSEALLVGENVLKNGGSSLDAVEQVIRLMEDSPLFNAGKGAVFTHEGKNEMDASIMDGSDLNAGAIAGVGDIRNPISLARLVMEKSEHVMLSGKGASDFALEQGISLVDSSYFFTEKRWKSLQEQLKKNGVEKYSTVGCVALDRKGNLAAGTSTGGMTNKKFGRIGDSPVIGAGNYASNSSCAVSATGHGEYFIRYTVAHDIAALMEYSGLMVHQAASRVIHQKLKEAGGNGGVICLDTKGNIAMEFNTTGMFRAWARSDGERGVLVFKED